MKAINILAPGVLLLVTMLNECLASGADNPVQLNGFASQSLIHTTQNNFFGKSKNDISPSFSELGVSIFTQLNNRTQASAQVLSRNAGKQADGEIRVDYLLIDMDKPLDDNSRIGVRIGRIKNPLGLYMETRDVAFTRPAILLPQSLYFDRTRNLGLSADSVHFYGDKSFDEYNDVNVVFGVGTPSIEDDNTKDSLLGLSAGGEIKGEQSYLGRVMWHADSVGMLTALSAARLNLSYSPGLGEGTKDGGIDATFIFLSWQFSTQNYSLTSEYAIRKFNFQNLQLFIPDYYEEVTGESYYLQLEYFFQPRFKLLTRYDVAYQDRRDHDGSVMETFGRPAYVQFAKDFTLGLRWDINRNFMIGVEHHWIDGTAWLPIADNPNVMSQRRYWNMLLTSISARF